MTIVLKNTSVTVRNINGAYAALLQNLQRTGLWRKESPRGLPVLEYNTMFITEYEKPRERILFDSTRDCNPFFHLFESLWILDGRKDVQFISRFNPRMAEFSDDGEVFHAAYGYRLRRHFRHSHNLERIDQITEVIRVLKEDPDTRQAVLALWDPGADLGKRSKDIPCNDIIFFKLRDNRLHMTVCCRSNDAFWGAYGTNVVQFSMLQEFIATSVGAEVGSYSQVSNNFHVYTENEVYKRAMLDPWQTIGASSLVTSTPMGDPYTTGGISPYPIMREGSRHTLWLQELHYVLDLLTSNAPLTYLKVDPFFMEVVCPLFKGWRIFKEPGDNRENNILKAVAYITENCRAEDWSMACVRWLARRLEVTTGEKGEDKK